MMAKVFFTTCGQEEGKELMQGKVSRSIQPDKRGDQHQMLCIKRPTRNSQQYFFTRHTPSDIKNFLSIIAWGLCRNS